MRQLRVTHLQWVKAKRARTPDAPGRESGEKQQQQREEPQEAEHVHVVLRRNHVPHAAHRRLKRPHNSDVTGK